LRKIFYDFVSYLDEGNRDEDLQWVAKYPAHVIWAAYRFWWTQRIDKLIHSKETADQVKQFLLDTHVSIHYRYYFVDVLNP